MGVVRDVTIEQLAQAVSGINTGGLMTDATGQAIKASIDNIVARILPLAENVSYDNTSSDIPSNNVQGAIDFLFTKLLTSIGSEIPAGTSLNNVTNTGIYYFTASSAISDAPFTNNSGCNLYVLPRSGITSRVFQVVISYLSTGCNISIRAMSGASSWTAWHTI